MKKVSYTFILLWLIFLLGNNLNAQVFISANVPDDCAPAIVDLYNSSDLFISDTAICEWDINGDIYDDYDLPGMKFEAGYYYVTLTMFDGPNYLGADYFAFEIYPNGDSFTISSGSEACPGEQIQFNYDDDISYYSVQWTFSDNSVPEDQHMYNWPTHTFYEPGIYDVTLVIDHFCGPDTVVQQVNVSSAAKPKVIGYLTNGPDYCPSDPVNFDVEGEYTAYHWDFGDGTSSNKRKPSHVYPNDAAASYTAIVSATNICGNSDTSHVTVTFTEDIEAYAGFDYYYDAQSLYPCPGTPVEFDAWGAGIYEWNFGDGSISNEQKPTNHYTEPGIYDISLTVWNGCGNTDFWQETIEVQLNPSDQPYANFYFQLAGENRDQLWDDTIVVCPGMPINFIDASYSFSPSDFVYDWNFGDGTNARTKNPFHIYNTASPVAYVVTLNVSNSCGGNSSWTRYVRVDDNLKPDVIPMVTPLTICPGEEVYFYIDEGMHSGDYTFDIVFGDGDVLNNAKGYGDSLLQTVANHTYSGTDGQTFPYSFNITNTCGNSVQTNGTVTIDTDPANVPFYYVSNSTTYDDGGQMKDWSVRQDPTDHEFVIHAVWPAWPGTQDKFVVFFWYEGFDPAFDPGPPNGYVEFKSSNIYSGDSIHAFIPMNPAYPPTIGLAVGWTCSGEYPSRVEPDVWGGPMDFIGMPIYSLPLIPSGYTDLLSLGDPIMLDPSWDGICRSNRPANDYYYQLNPGQYIQLHLDPDYNEYYMDASGDQNGYDWIASLDYGDYYLLNESTIQFISYQACGESSSEYTYILNGDQMELAPVYDNCPEREKYLAGKTFFEQLGMGEGGMLAGCPGDEILFTIAGGANYEWHFGDGTTSNERYPRHIYAAPGEYDAFVKATNNCGRVDTIHTPVTISNANLPMAGFWWDGDNIPRMQPINFYYDEYDFDQAGNYTYSWKFGDGTTSSLKNPSHAYERNGDYTIELKVSNGCGSNTNVQMIYISDAVLSCEAKIHIDAIDGRTISLKDISRGEITNWFWDFGDGFTSSSKNPVHTYSQDGVFFVCLAIYDSINECSHQICRMVEIGTQRCISNFTAKVNEATRKVQFTDLSTNGTEWFWEFGDGDFTDVRNPLHTYDEPGWYNVCLTIYDNATDCFAFRCMEIKVGEEDSQFCFADFEYFVNEDELSIIFKDKSSDNITDWYWTFGDGTYREGRSPTKKYTGPGIYNVCLFVFDQETGCTDEICMEIPVGVSDCNLRADFAFFIDINNSEVTFSDRSGGNPTNYFWDFGDGGSSSARSPKHKYEEPGFYPVILSIRDELNDCDDYMLEFLQIGVVDCRAAFEYKVDAATQNVQFYNQSKADLDAIAEYFWDFDDGSFSDEKNPQHNFARPGMYFVSLTVITANGLCMDFVFEPIQVGTVECAANFKYYIDSSTNVAYFTPEKIGSATAYLWIFGDGAISTKKEARHTFSDPGYFTVGLNTYNENTNCMDYWEEVILISSAGKDCRADFSYISNPATRKISFGNRSKGKINQYLWDFGDGNTSTLKSPEHVYDAGGYYMVCLTVVNNFGIPNTYCDFVQLATNDQERCFADFIYAVDSASRTVEFVQQSHGNPDIFLWNFGDDNISTEENPEHKYGTSDYFLVELHIENSSSNCSHNGYALINVSEGNKGLQSAFSYRIDSSNLKAETYPVDFIGVSLGDAGKLKWTFGDGSTDTTSLNPTHIYADPGIYEACLIISDPNTGASDTTCQQVTTPGYVGVINEVSRRNMIGNYPNPFDLSTTIVYELSGGTSVDLVLYDQTGRMIDILVREDQSAGRHQFEYDGSRLDSGIYTLRLATDQGVYTTLMVVR